MNKQAELEQAYWNGFATKCAEYGVDAEKLAQAVPEFRAVGTEAVANANRRAAAKANEPDWLDTPQDLKVNPHPKSSHKMDTALFRKNERLRLNRALSAGTTSAPLEHSRYPSYFDGKSQSWGTPGRFLTARNAGFVAPYGMRHDDPRTKVPNPVEATLNRDALSDYDWARERNTPREAERILGDRGYGTPQIEFIRELIRKGIIQANTRRPASGTAIG